MRSGARRAGFFSVLRIFSYILCDTIWTISRSVPSRQVSCQRVRLHSLVSTATFEVVLVRQSAPGHIASARSNFTPIGAWHSRRMSLRGPPRSARLLVVLLVACFASIPWRCSAAGFKDKEGTSCQLQCKHSPEKQCIAVLAVLKSSAVLMCLSKLSSMDSTSWQLHLQLLCVYTLQL